MIAREDKAVNDLFEMVEGALEAPQGREAVADATSYLVSLLERNSFNSARAIEVYGMAIDNIVWAFLKNKPNGCALYSSYRSSGINQEFGMQLTNIFTKDGKIRDQRPVRTRLRWLLGA